MHLPEKIQDTRGSHKEEMRGDRGGTCGRRESPPRGISGQVFHRCGKVLRFFGSGVIATLTDLGILYGLTSFLGIWYIASAVIAYCCGILVSYCMNKYVTFHDHNRQYFTQFSIFTAISLSCLCLNLSILWMLVEIFSVHYIVAKIIAIFCGFLWSYYGQSRITFRQSEFSKKSG